MPDFRYRQTTATLDGAQMLPPLRNGKTAQLHDPKIENKETRPPSRYNEGTLIEAMRNAWRFVDDEVLRERLKESRFADRNRSVLLGVAEPSVTDAKALRCDYRTQRVPFHASVDTPERPTLFFLMTCQAETVRPVLPAAAFPS